MKKQVIIKFEVDGFHNYPDAPAEVNFLQNKHRHTFVITCAYNVKSLKREKEIFIQRDLVKEYLHESFGNQCQFDDMSCEMIASEILEFAQEDGMVWCEVWEENTGGARVEL